MTTTEITKPQLCIYQRNGIEIWVDKEKAMAIAQDLESFTGKFISVEGRVLNVMDIVGIYKPVDLDEKKRRDRGQYKCDFGEWHDRTEICDCAKMINRKTTSDKVREDSMGKMPNSLGVKEGLDKLREKVNSFQ